MRVEIATSADREAWDAYVTAQSEANFYHLYDWNEIFRKTFGCETCYLVSKSNERITGILPLFIIKNYLLGGNYISSLPGGICTDEPEAAYSLLEAAIALTQDRGAKYLKLRDGHQEWDHPLLKTKIEYVYVLDNLPADPQVIWADVKANVRTPVRKARKENLIPVWNNNNLDSFYRVYAINMRDLGTPAIPHPLFEQALRKFSDNIKILTVYYKKQIIGGMFLFTLKDVFFNPFTSSLRRFFQFCPNDLLYWEAITYACEQGYCAFDMGTSLKDSGNARFKEKFLAKPRQVFYQYYLNTTQAVPASRGGSAYYIVSRVWKQLPVWAANRFSPIIRRIIPLG